jgi:hypothetical protein
MKFKISYIRDVVGNNYLGINIYQDAVYPFLEKLKVILADEYDTYIKNQQNRDRGHYHITLINPIDFNNLSKDMGIDKFINSLESVFDYEFDDVKFMGLGTAEKAGRWAYFVVVNSKSFKKLERNITYQNKIFTSLLDLSGKMFMALEKSSHERASDLFESFIRALF